MIGQHHKIDPTGGPWLKEDRVDGLNLLDSRDDNVTIYQFTNS